MHMHDGKWEPHVSNGSKHAFSTDRCHLRWDNLRLPPSMLPAQIRDTSTANTGVDKVGPSVRESFANQQARLQLQHGRSHPTVRRGRRGTGIVATVQSMVEMWS